MKPLVLFGTTAQARIAAHYFEQDSEYQVVAFTADEQFIADRQQFEGRPLVPFESLLREYPPADCDLFVAVGYTNMNRLRAHKVEAALSAGYRLPSYVSPRCTYLSDTQPGPNSFILEDNTIQPFVTIGKNVTMWSGNHIGHDSVVRDHTFISSHVVVSGFVTVEESCFLGVNSTIRDGVTVGASTLIGAGAVVLADLDPDSVIVPPRSVVLDKKSWELGL